MNEFNLERKENTKNGWLNETEKYSNEILEFIKDENNFKKYDHFSELHISGDNFSVLSSALKGELLPSDVEVFYKNNIPEQIKIRYANQGKGHDIDIFISGKALDNFLSVKK